VNAEIRQASPGELDALMALVRDCIAGMRRRGIDQWDDVYPDRAIIERDLDEGAAFVATLREGPVGMAVLNQRQDPEYADVDWLYGGRPAVIHRLMVSPKQEGRGIARALMAYLEARARALGFDCVRLDTFMGNPKAIRFYERSGYRRAGQVRFRKGEFQCFEKRLLGG
jgi:ribosomal protein S18 acetylase RimI-like enzyme